MTAWEMVGWLMLAAPGVLWVCMMAQKFGWASVRHYAGAFVIGLACLAWVVLALMLAAGDLP